MKIRLVAVRIVERESLDFFQDDPQIILDTIDDGIGDTYNPSTITAEEIEEN